MKGVCEETGLSIAADLISGYRPMHTLSREVAISGVGLHSGSHVNMAILPAEPGSGIRFRRTDLPHYPEIPASLSAVQDTRRCTTIGRDGVYIHTVEHVLAALFAYRVDNAVVELSECEPPAAGGCSEPFVELIEAAGVVDQDEQVPIVSLKQAVYYSSGDVHLVALPHDEYRISYTLDYPQVKLLSAQYCSMSIEPQSFASQLAPCRTFAPYEELSALMDAGLIKGGSLDSAVVIKGDQVLSKGGLRFPNEMARHKVLDLVGDLSLIRGSFAATSIDLCMHVIAIRSGHATNVAFTGRLYNYLTTGGTQ